MNEGVAMTISLAFAARATHVSRPLSAAFAVPCALYDRYGRCSALSHESEGLPES
jgi:hypothetical protein